MSYFDDASLVMIPSGYKTSKVYSVKPTSGDGDLTFTRSNDTATRVGPDGLIEKVRTNVLLYSNTFSSWTNQNSADTGGQPDKDGGTTAWKLVGDTTNGRHNLNRANVTTGEHTISIYAKASGHSFLQLATAQTADQYANFNLTDGTLGTVGNDFSNGQITSVGGGWYRISVISKNQTNTIYLSLVSSNTAGWLESWAMPNNTDGVLIMDGQLEAGVLTPFIGNTTTSGVSVGPVANVPRLDYLGSSCPRLLLEPQRTNLVTFSDGFTNGWTASGGTITATANYGISPDGYQNSTRIQFAAANLIWRKSVVGLTGNVGTWSLYIKGTAGETLQITYGGFDLLITLGTGWNRYSVTGTGTIDEVFINTFSGSTARDIEVYGGQAELGAYATSYIPTLGAAVTRGAEAASKTGIASLIGQAEGTLFVDFNVLPSTLAGSYFLETFLSDGTASNKVGITYYNDGRIQFVAFAGGGLVVNINLPSYGLTVGKHKMAFAYKLNDYVAYVDGALVGTDTSAAVGAMSVLDLYDTSGGTHAVNQALVFKTRLSNADLAALTA